MTGKTDYPQRKSNRLKGYDYAQSGAYFVTICTSDKKCILSKVESQSRRDRACPCPQIKLTYLGNICVQTFKEIEKRFAVRITDYIIMPNHIHLIIFVDSVERTAARAVPTISDIIGSYKSIVANKWLRVCKHNGIKMNGIWERSFYDHIIRDDEDYYIKARYIEENLIRWHRKNNII